MSLQGWSCSENEVRAPCGVGGREGIPQCTGQGDVCTHNCLARASSAVTQPALEHVCLWLCSGLTSCPTGVPLLPLLGTPPLALGLHRTRAAVCRAGAGAPQCCSLVTCSTALRRQQAGFKPFGWGDRLFLLHPGTDWQASAPSELAQNETCPAAHWTRELARRHVLCAGRWGSCGLVPVMWRCRVRQRPAGPVSISIRPSLAGTEASTEHDLRGERRALGRCREQHV